MEYKWIAQDKDGKIFKFQTKPQAYVTKWFYGGHNFYQYGKENSNWENSLINLETHDYKIEDGILMKVEKEQKRIMGRELQRKNIYGEWIDCESTTEYRIKHKTKVVRFRNYLNTDNDICVCEEGCEPADEVIKQLLGDWQEVEVSNEKQWPSDLVEHISKVDIKAAKWIDNNWSNLDCYRVTKNKNISKIRDLSSLFVWDFTPQGYEYWADMSRKL